MASLLLISLFIATLKALFDVFIKFKTKRLIANVVAKINPLIANIIARGAPVVAPTLATVRNYTQTIKANSLDRIHGIRMAITPAAQALTEGARLLADYLPTPLCTQLQDVWYAMNGVAIGIALTLHSLLSLIKQLNRLISVSTVFVADVVLFVLDYHFSRRDETTGAHIWTGNTYMWSERFSRFAAVTVTTPPRLILAVKLLEVVVSLATLMLPYTVLVISIATYGHFIAH